MAKVLISDMSRVVLFPKDRSHEGGLNALHKELIKDGNYDFWEYFKLNKELVDYYMVLKKKGVDVHVFTSGLIQDYSPLREVLKKYFGTIHSATKMEIHKSAPDAYKILLGKLDIDPSSVIYVDDKPANLDAANEAGIFTIQYLTNSDVISKIDAALAS